MPHPPAGATQPLGDAGLAEPLAPPAAGPVAVGLGGPGDHRQDDQERREHPQQGANDGGHGSFVVEPTGASLGLAGRLEMVRRIAPTNT